jgi:hypothetical protein
LADDRRHLRSDDLQLNEADFLSLVRDSLQRCSAKDVNNAPGDTFG